MVEMIEFRGTTTPDGVIFIPVKPLLTNQEYKVMYLLSCGMTVKGVAYELNLSPSTVRVYIRQIYIKFNLPHSMNQRVAAINKFKELYMKEMVSKNGEKPTPTY